MSKNFKDQKNRTISGNNGTVKGVRPSNLNGRIPGQVRPNGKLPGQVGMHAKHPNQMMPNGRLPGQVGTNGNLPGQIKTNVKMNGYKRPNIDMLGKANSFKEEIINSNPAKNINNNAQFGEMNSRYNRSYETEQNIDEGSPLNAFIERYELNKVNAKTISIASILGALLIGIIIYYVSVGGGDPLNNSNAGNLTPMSTYSSEEASNNEEGDVIQMKEKGDESDKEQD